MSEQLLVTLGSGAAQRERTVEIDPLPIEEGRPPSYRVAVDGRRRTVELVRHDATGYTLRDLATDEIFPVDLDGALPLLTVTLGDQTLPAKVESARRHALLAVAQRDRSGGGTIALVAPIPGRVVKLLVAKDAAVKAGQGLVLLEAMKMENEVRAPRDGTIAELRVREGQAVEAQETLLTLA